MFWSEIHADLPSDIDADGVTYTPTRLVRVLRSVMRAAEITDLAWLRVDGRVLRVDTDGRNPEDLDGILTAFQDASLLGEGFDHLDLVLVRWEEEIHHAIHARVVRSPVALEHELIVRISSRPDDVNARRLDDAPRFVERLQGLAAAPGVMDRYRARVERLVGRVGDALERALFRRRVEVQRVMLRLVRPTLDEVAALAEVPFGARITPPAYRIALPEEGGDFDPLVTVEADPWRVARHQILLDAILDGDALHRSWVEVVDADGRHLFDGTEAARFRAGPWRRRYAIDAVKGGGFEVRFAQGGPSRDPGA